jgi:serine/threonine protein phosphatase PrpC
VTARADRTALRWGGATDVGRVRPGNEDHFLARPESDLFVVADGMGGHRGGEVASEIACDAVGDAFAEHTVDGLIDAIEQANVAVHDAGVDDPELSGMGTTVVALAVVVHDDDEVVAIANVGDSRCYRYADGELDQVTTDHSLVADLVREGSLSPEEAAVHPQRNIVTRVLGVNVDVPVDVFVVDPRAGDRFVLCSDGLFNEVPEPGIATVLRRLTDPDDAAHELVRLAVEGGGRDNVTVVVVDVVNDGGRTAAATAALARDGVPGTARSRGPASSPAYADEPTPSRRRGRRGGGATDTAELDRFVGVDDLDGELDAGIIDEADADDLEAVPRHTARGARTRRRLTWRVALFTLLVLALVGGVVATIQWYGTSAYFVGFDGDQVAIYQGRPGGLLWIDPELVDVTDLGRHRVPASRREDIDRGVEQSSLADARRYVANVTEQADELDPPTTSTTAPTTTTVPPTTARPAAPGTTAARA